MGCWHPASIAEQAHFRWGVVPMPEGPVGRVSVINGIAAAANSATRHPDAVRQVLTWMGSERGNQYLGRRGAAIRPSSPRSGSTSTTGRGGASTSARSSRFSTGRGYRRRAGPGFPRAIRRCSRIPTRCSSAGAMWPRHCAMPRPPRTPQPSVKSWREASVQAPVRRRTRREPPEALSSHAVSAPQAPRRSDPRRRGR